MKAKVTIFGSSYTVQGEADSEYIAKLAKYVDGKMNEVSRSMGNCNVLQAAILAALNIADEYYQLRDIDSSLDVSIMKKANALISMLEEGIIGDAYPRIKGVREATPDPEKISEGLTETYSNSRI
jgi:cell division protein ZapA